jgi:hypothetical protein
MARGKITHREWRDAEIKRLRRLAEAGKSMAEAARMLGRSRNSVAGKADREGVRFQGWAGGNPCWIA